jgi:hypothetical protein
MDCEQVESLLGRFYDGEVNAAERDLIATHVERCQACASEVEALAQLDRSSRKLRCLEPPPDVWDRIAERLAANSPGQSKPRAVVGRRRFVLVGGVVAASVAGGVLASVLVQRSSTEVPQGGAAKTRPAVSGPVDLVLVNLALLGAEDRQLAELQEVCAAGGCDVRLGAEGRPVKIALQDSPVFCCSHECELWARAHPGEALAKARTLVHRHQTGLAPAIHGDRQR